MRIKSQKQLYIKPQSAALNPNDILEAISRIIDELPELDVLLEQILQDVTPKNSRAKTGSKGMTAEQVFRALIVKNIKDYSYRELEQASKDSISVREFLKIPFFKKGYDFKTFQANMKLLKEETIDQINEVIKKFAKQEGIEDGNKIRADAFSTASNIHYPTDWSLMNNSIRVLSRIMTTAFEDLQVPIVFTNHYRASKKKLFKIHNGKNQKKRRAWNLELICLTSKTVLYAKQSLLVMVEKSLSNSLSFRDALYLDALIAKLKHYIPLAEQVLEQAHRRIVKGEKLSSEEKLVSIFEEHADIIAKGQRDVIFGHKNTITTGESGLILAVQIHDGNPADSTIVKSIIDNHKNFYGTSPVSAVFDGCYSSKANRELATKEKIKNICFSKETEQESSCTRAIRKMLRNFRAGIEASVSMLKRMFGLTRIMDRGFHSFKAGVKASVLAYNLFMLARIKLQN